MSRIAIFLAGVFFGLALAYVLNLTTGSAPEIEQAVDDAPATPAKVAAGPAPVSETFPAGDSPVTGQPVSEPDPEFPQSEPIVPTEELVVQEPLAEATLAPEPPSGLLIPVVGITAGGLSDTFTDSRGSGRAHDAIDIMATRGTTVVAVDDGRVVKLFKSVPGGLTVYQFDPTEKFAYYYAHLDRYASGLVEGRQLKRGDVIGYVGSTGNASSTAPHLHFAITVLGPEKRWWEGTAINPYPLLTGNQKKGDD